MIQNKVRLISFHIPKTAGTSFRNMLASVYGKEHLIRFDIQFVDKEVSIQEEVFVGDRLPDHITVIHGHFMYEDLQRLFDIHPDAVCITWLRNPVARVISNFYYLDERLREILPPHRHAILDNLEKSLEEYYKTEINRNRQYKFLNGLPLDKFLFVGICEEFEQEVADLRKLLYVPQMDVLKHNETKQKASKAQQLPQSVLDDIARHNELDMQLYQQALDLQKRRKAQLAGQ